MKKFEEKFEVGDKVRHDFGPYTEEGIILAVYETTATVEFEGYATRCQLNNLTHIEEKQDKPLIDLESDSAFNILYKMRSGYICALLYQDRNMGRAFYRQEHNALWPVSRKKSYNGQLLVAPTDEESACENDADFDIVAYKKFTTQAKVIEHLYANYDDIKWTWKRETNLDVLKKKIAKAQSEIQAIKAIRECYDFHHVRHTDLKEFVKILNAPAEEE